MATVSSTDAHARYRRVAWTTAPLWSALVLLLPDIRADLHTGLNFRGMEPSWWRAGIAAAGAGCLFVVLAAIGRRAILARTRRRRAFAAVGGLLVGFWVFSSLFVMACLAERDGLHTLMTLRSVPMFLYVWPLMGLVVTAFVNPFAWAASVLLALFSVGRLHRAAGGGASSGAGTADGTSAGRDAAAGAGTAEGA